MMRELLRFGGSPLVAGAAAFVFFGVVGWWVSRRHLTREERELNQAAARLRSWGYSVSTGPSAAPALPFPEFAPSRNGTTTLYVTQRDAAAFRIAYEGRANEETLTGRFVCAVVPVPFTSPRISIWRGNRRAAGAVMSDAVDTDSERFNEEYAVKCGDERFAYTLLSYELIEWFLNEPAFSSGLTVRIEGNTMLLVKAGIDPEEIVEVLTMAEMVRDRMPAVLSSLYPVPG